MAMLYSTAVPPKMFPPPAGQSKISISFIARGAILRVLDGERQKYRIALPDSCEYRPQGNRYQHTRFYLLRLLDFRKFYCGSVQEFTENIFVWASTGDLFASDVRIYQY